MSVFDDLGRPLSPCSMVLGRQELRDSGGGVGASGTTSPPSTAGGGGISPSATQSGYRFARETIKTPQSSAQRSVTIINAPLYENPARIQNSNLIRTAKEFVDSQSEYSSKKTLERSDSLRQALSYTWIMDGGALQFHNRQMSPDPRVPFRLSFEEAEYSPDNRLESRQRARLMLDDDTIRGRYTTMFRELQSNKYYFTDVYWNGKGSEYWSWFNNIQRLSRPAFPFSQLSANGTRNMMPNVWYKDYVFTAPLALHAKEVDNLVYKANNPVVDIAAVVNFDDQNEGVTGLYRGPETKKTSLYRLYGRTYKGHGNNEGLCSIDDRLQKYNSANTREMISEANGYSSSFESFVEIKITNPDRHLSTHSGGITSGTIIDLLSKYNMDQVLLAFLDSPTFSRTTYRLTEIYDEVVDALGALPNISTSENDRVTTFVDYPIVEDIERKIVALASIKHSLWQPKFWEYPLKHKTVSPLESAIKGAMFLSEFKNLIRTSGLDRTVEEVLSGEPAPNFIVGYKIVKSSSLSLDQDQVFYVMRPKADPGEYTSPTELTFVDTQVNVGSDYTYKIYAINLVIGTKYRYDNFFVDDPGGGLDSAMSPGQQRALRELRARNGGQASFSGTSRPVYNLVESPFYERTVAVVPSPPMPPEVSFKPYRGDDTKVALCFFVAPGEVVEYPIQLLESDGPIIKKMKEKDSYKYGEKVRYVNDSLPDTFQIFRLETPPESYSDFGAADYIRTIRATGKTGFTGETIEPNKTYYYMFRTLDESGVSNPSKVLQFTLISYSNGIYMDLKEFNFKKSTKQFKIGLKNMLKIMPNYKQKMINFTDDVSSRAFYSAVPEEQNIDLGHTPDNEVWGRNFKIRIRSTSSGRAMDLKFVFNKEKKTFYPPEPIRVPEPPAPCGTVKDVLRAAAGSLPADATGLLERVGNDLIHTGGGFQGSHFNTPNDPFAELHEEPYRPDPRSTGGGLSQSEIDASREADVTTRRSRLGRRHRDRGEQGY